MGRSPEGAGGAANGSLAVRPRRVALVLASVALLGPGGRAADGAGQGPGEDREGIAFFEKAIRPVLVDRCAQCHGPGAKEPKGGLSLQTREGMLRGGDSGPAIVPGDPDTSLLIQAIRYEGELVRMPPKGRLAPQEVAAFADWVRRGAPAPPTMLVADRPAAKVPSPAGDHWAFRPPADPPVPSNAARDPIDAFILAELEARGLSPAPPADRRTLLRRASFDLTGLPPTPDEIDAFLRDESPDAFAKVVDRLLASPAYGERWGRHWLDVVRYTDYHAPDPLSHGRAALFELFEAWRYRDWVVEAFNRDMPYDEFVVHQVAGDRLPSPSGGPVYPEGLVATTFLAIGTWDNGDADKDKIVSDIADDQIDVVGRAFLGLTIACARCHDHKFDPISQQDYYGLAGIFYSTHILANVGTKGDHTVALRVPLVPPEYLAKREQQEERLRVLDAALRRLDPKGAALIVAPGAMPAQVSTAVIADREGIKREREALRAGWLPSPPLALAAQEGGTPGGLFTGIQDVPLHIRGSYTRLGKVVRRRLPAVLAGDHQPPIKAGSGRIELARWIARPDHPLTARVLVNRIWQWHFGAGIVRTPSNFGKLGEPPTHPQLLDWLARQFVRDGWSIKRLQRRIMLTAAYQRASAVPQAALRLDPENRWLGRANVRRLEAEAIRDAMLCAAGRLDPALGGPANADLDRPRRSLYVQTVRQDRTNFSTLFDAANPEQSVEARTVSTVAPQALFLLNSPFAQAQAERLSRLCEQVPGDDADRIDRAYLWLFGRPARAEEVRIGREFLERAAGRGRDAAWADYAHLLLCTNEFLYVD